MLVSSTMRARGRWLSNVAGIAMTAIAAGGIALIMIFILGYVIREGIGAISLSFLIHLPHPVGVPGGGVGNGIAGTFIIVGMAAAMAIPIGLLVGVFLAVYGRGRWADGLRFASDVLASVPSIAVGLFAYTLFVEPFKHFSAFSASFAFAVLMIPIIVRTTEGALRQVPVGIREAAVSLGASPYLVITRCTLPAAKAGIITGMLLALARVTGETAPLLFTAFGSQFWEFKPNNPMAELSLQIFTYAISPYRVWHEQAWGAALILIFAVFVLSALARFSLKVRQSSA